MSAPRTMVTAALALLVAACGGGAATGSGRAPQRCVPDLPVASPTRVPAGGVVVVSDRGVPCKPFAHPQRLTVVLLPPRKPGGHPDLGHEIALKSFRVGRRAAFRVRVRVPRSVFAGAAELGVRGRALDKRLECPPNADCAYFGARIVITR